MPPRMQEEFMRFTRALLALMLVVASFSLAVGEEQTKSNETKAKTQESKEKSDEAKGKSDETKRIENATTVVSEFAGMSEGPPRSLVEGAAGVVVIPGLIKAGLGIGGKHGKGVLTIKNADG